MIRKDPSEHDLPSPVEYIECDHCGDFFHPDVDHNCVCKECERPLGDLDISKYEDTCIPCGDAEWQMEMRAGFEESNWRNDHGDFN